MFISSSQSLSEPSALNVSASIGTTLIELNLVSASVASTLNAIWISAATPTTRLLPAVATHYVYPRS